MNLELRLWLKHSGGLSSYTIAFVLCPLLRDFVDGCAGSFGIGHAPSDPSDFWRCREVLKLIPNGVERLGEVAAQYPDSEWPALVAVWGELAALFEEESKRADKMAPKLFQRMTAMSLAHYAARKPVNR